MLPAAIVLRIILKYLAANQSPILPSKADCHPSLVSQHWPSDSIWAKLTYSNSGSFDPPLSFLALAIIPNYCPMHRTNARIFLTPWSAKSAPDSQNQVCQQLTKRKPCRILQTFAYRHRMLWRLHQSDLSSLFCSVGKSLFLMQKFVCNTYGLLRLH